MRAFDTMKTLRSILLLVFLVYLVDKHEVESKTNQNTTVIQKDICEFSWDNLHGTLVWSLDKFIKRNWRVGDKDYDNEYFLCHQK